MLIVLKIDSGSQFIKIGPEIIPNKKPRPHTNAKNSEIKDFIPTSRL
jgi:hypothetical protein